MDVLIDGCSGADGWMRWQQCAEWKQNRADTMVVEVVMGAVVLMDGIVGGWIRGCL